MKKLHLFATALFAALSLIACEGTDPTPPQPIVDPNDLGEGFFLLNEGAWNGNNSTLDFYDYNTNSLISNIFEARNPNETMGLGDLGNDLAMWNEQLFAVMNGSDLVHVIDASTVELLATIPVKSPRNIAFSGDFAYVTSYNGVTLDDPTVRGFVAKIDLKTFKVVAQCEVGRQPDGLAIVSDNLYVCNSGGYGEYETHLSVIDLATFTVVDSIEVAPNLHSVVYVDSALGSTLIAVPWDSKNLYQVNTQLHTVSQLPIAGSTIAYTDRALYAFGTTYDAKGNATVFYNTFSEGVIGGNFITDGTENQIVTPYGLAVDQNSGDILVTDADDYFSDGKIYCFSPVGKLKWSKTAGVAPSKIVFKY